MQDFKDHKVSPPKGDGRSTEFEHMLWYYHEAIGKGGEGNPTKAIMRRMERARAAYSGGDDPTINILGDIIEAVRRAYANTRLPIGTPAGLEEWRIAMVRRINEDLEFSDLKDCGLMISNHLSPIGPLIGPITPAHLYAIVRQIAEQLKAPVGGKGGIPGTVVGFGKLLSNRKQTIELELGVKITERMAGARQRFLSVEIAPEVKV